MVEGGGNLEVCLIHSGECCAPTEIHSVKIVEWRGSTNDMTDRQQLNSTIMKITVPVCCMQYVYGLPVYLKLKWERL